MAKESSKTAKDAVTITEHEALGAPAPQNQAERVVWDGAKLVTLIDGKEAYRYLPASVAYLPPPPELVSLIAAAGFDAAERRALSGGIAQLLTGTRA